MCKVCISCNGVMNYDPYFEAEICGKCGKMERKKRTDVENILAQQTNAIEAIKEVMFARMVPKK